MSGSHIVENNIPAIKKFFETSTSVNGWFTKAKKQAEMTKRVYEILDKKG
jgi:hypothetical protein